MKKKFFKTKIAGTIFALATVAVIFSFFPSCGKQTEIRSVQTPPHPDRDGHTKTVGSGTVSEDPEYIDDISFGMELNEDNTPKLVEVKLLYSNEGEGSEKKLVTLTGNFEQVDGGLAAKLSSQANTLVTGSANCITNDCTIIDFTIRYADKDGEMRSVTRQGARGTLERNTVAGNVVVGDVTVPIPASSEFLVHWRAYLTSLETQGKTISSELPQGLISTRLDGAEGSFITLNPEIATQTTTFARPINMRLSQNVTIDNEPTRIDGILINGEPLVNDSTKCVVWAEGFDQNKRYASALLNAVISFVSPTLKNGNACATLHLGEASKINGGKLEGKINFQNGLDVDISFITGVDPFSEMDIQANVYILTESTVLWNLIAFKRFYDTGMVNRFVTSPEIKSAFVKYARDNNVLSVYESALEKVYPEKGFASSHYRLEIGCSASNILENQWCRDTAERMKTWPVELCNDQTCTASESAVSESTKQQDQPENQPEEEFNACTEAQKQVIDQTEAIDVNSISECRSKGSMLGIFVSDSTNNGYVLCEYEEGKICRFKAQ